MSAKVARIRCDECNKRGEITDAVELFGVYVGYEADGGPDDAWLIYENDDGRVECPDCGADFSSGE